MPLRLRSKPTATDFMKEDLSNTLTDPTTDDDEERLSTTDESLPSSAQSSLSDSCLCVRTQTESLQRVYHPTSKKSVSFSTIAIYTHDIVLGDNPSGTYGPPLTIAWKARESTTLALDDYQAAHPEPRPREQLLVPCEVREDWLRSAGFARSQLDAASKEVQRIKKQRMHSAKDGERPSLREATQKLFQRRAAQHQCAAF